jgi:hypothetical protein
MFEPINEYLAHCIGQVVLERLGISMIGEGEHEDANFNFSSDHAACYGPGEKV